MPAPQGQTFFVVPGGGMANNGGLEFQHYAATRRAAICRREAIAPATIPEAANMIVELGYGMDSGQAPDSYAYGGLRPRLGGWGGGCCGRAPSLPGYGCGWGVGYSLGAGTIPSGTAAGSTAMSNIIARSTSTSAQPATTAPLFDGRAQARSDTNRLDVVIPSLVGGHVHRLPGPQRRDGQDHHPAASSSRRAY